MNFAGFLHTVNQRPIRCPWKNAGDFSAVSGTMGASQTFSLLLTSEKQKPYDFHAAVKTNWRFFQQPDLSFEMHVDAFFGEQHGAAAWGSGSEMWELISHSHLVCTFAADGGREPHMLVWWWWWWWLLIDSPSDDWEQKLQRWAWLWYQFWFCPGRRRVKTDLILIIAVMMLRRRAELNQ